MRTGELVDDLSEPERALVQYAIKVTDAPAKITAADIQMLREHGWGNAEIVEALTCVLMAAFTNTLALSMHFEEDLEPMGFEGYF
jgi:alkylhydroperoxidase family enzyme